MDIYELPWKSKELDFKILNMLHVYYCVSIHTPYTKMAAILVFFCLLENEPLLPRLRETILLNFKFKNKVKRANLQVNKGILKWWSFWNNMYREILKEWWTLSVSGFNVTCAIYRPAIPPGWVGVSSLFFSSKTYGPENIIKMWQNVI